MMMMGASTTAAATDKADRSAIPDLDLAVLLHVIERRREAGLCGRHQHSSQPGCAAVAVWAIGQGPGGHERPTALFCRDRLGRYSAFSGDGRLLASGSINDVIRWWR